MSRDVNVPMSEEQVQMALMVREINDKELKL